MLKIYTSDKGFKFTQAFSNLIVCPEVYKHPKEQVKIARKLAKKVNEGNHILLATNSDFIIKELNTLIMLNALYCGTEEDKKGAKKIMKKHKYSSKELLDHKNVKYYEIINGEEKEKKVAEYGIETKSMDKVIDKMNDIQTEIIYYDEDSFRRFAKKAIDNNKIM
jgi:DNA-directed RNA polymerase subunit H (RpoH/RPB5)